MSTESGWKFFPGDLPCGNNTTILVSSIQANISAFAILEKENDFKAVKRFRRVLEEAFIRIDTDYCKLCKEERPLVIWADRMRTVRRHLDEIDRNLPFEGKRQFNWDAVIIAISTLCAFRLVSEQTVELNKPHLQPLHK